MGRTGEGIRADAGEGRDGNCKIAARAGTTNLGRHAKRVSASERSLGDSIDFQ